MLYFSDFNIFTKILLNLKFFINFIIQLNILLKFKIIKGKGRDDLGIEILQEAEGLIRRISPQ